MSLAVCVDGWWGGLGTKNERGRVPFQRHSILFHGVELRRHAAPSPGRGGPRHIFFSEGLGRHQRTLRGGGVGGVAWGWLVSACPSWLCVWQRQDAFYVAVVGVMQRRSLLLLRQGDVHTKGQNWQKGSLADERQRLPSAGVWSWCALSPHLRAAARGKASRRPSVWRRRERPHHQINVAIIHTVII